MKTTFHCTVFYLKVLFELILKILQEKLNNMTFEYVVNMMQ